jgi:hypothetical protein
VCGRRGRGRPFLSVRGAVGSLACGFGDYGPTIFVQYYVLIRSRRSVFALQSLCHFFHLPFFALLFFLALLECLWASTGHISSPSEIEKAAGLVFWTQTPAARLKLC